MLRSLPNYRIRSAVAEIRRNHNVWPSTKPFRSLFTNTDAMKRDDPYATLDLQWGATTSEIKEAYKKLARELHPDVNKEDTPEQALKKFQRVQKAYSKLMDVKGAPHRDDLMEVRQKIIKHYAIFIQVIQRVTCNVDFSEFCIHQPVSHFP